MRKCLLIAAKALGALVGTLGVLSLLGIIAFLLFALPSGAKAPPPTFEFKKDLTIEKTGPGGLKYTVNNSTATFHLDVAGPDKHCARLFPDYAAALRYCWENGLPAIPSVQMVQGKCKQFDDRLCAALEAAVQEGVPGEERLGKRAALKGLLKKLAGSLATVPERHKPVVRGAAVHVAAALALGGERSEIDGDLAADVERAAAAFLERPEASRPVGFWSQSDLLRGIFRQDRFLSKGLSLDADLPVCVVLAATVAGDPRLSEAFGRFREFDSKMTNPAERCVSCAELAALLPPGAKPGALLDAEALAGVRTSVSVKFGGKAGFALVSYSESKEYSLLRELLETGDLSGREETMSLIVEAVRSGRLRLDPKPGSGWYDYQWHALETLLVPERAPEAPKLYMTQAYRERLENAFKTALTKQRETRIKQLPFVYLGSFDDEEKPPKVKIGPEFCVEPTATVYLRCARGYRFLRNSMHGVLGEESLKKVRMGAAGPDLDEELRRMALLCYGLYERLCLEIGRSADYLEGELVAEERAAARSEAAAWLADPAGDADMAADTRVAVPIAVWPGGPVRHWATGGVRLERVEYKYRDLPTVSYKVKPVFVPTLRYLPSDVFLEFEYSAGAPLTREEFRALCDRSPDEGALRAALGAAPARRRGGGFPWALSSALLLVAAAVALGWRFRRRLRAMWARRPRRLLLKTTLGVAVALLLAALMLVIFTGLRTRFLVKCVARVSTHIGLIVENWWFCCHASLSAADHLADLLSDHDPQVRYLAARFLSSTEVGLYSKKETLSQVPGMKARLQAAADDDLPEVAAEALSMLGDYHDEQNVDFLLAKLDRVRGVDQLCGSAICALGQTLSPRALEAILPFTCDARRQVRWWAVWALGRSPDERAARRLAELVQSEDERDSEKALHAIESSLYRNPGFKEIKEIYDPALLAAARITSFRPSHRWRLVDNIDNPAIKVEAYLAIFRQPSATKDTSAEECRETAAKTLAKLCPEKQITVERLAELTKDPSVNLAELAAALLKKE